MSFSKAEALLFQEMGIERVLLYCLVKNIFVSCNLDKEVFKTYYIKTLFFWFLEKVPAVHFYIENSGVLLINFINTILLAIIVIRIPHYFIPNVNIIESMTKDVSLKIYHKIKNLLNNLHTQFIN
jgi:hypothetical protein